MEGAPGGGVAPPTGRIAPLAGRLEGGGALAPAAPGDQEEAQGVHLVSWKRTSLREGGVGTMMS